MYLADGITQKNNAKSYLPTQHNMRLLLTIKLSFHNHHLKKFNCTGMSKYYKGED